VEGILRAHLRFALEQPTRFRIATSWVNSDYSVADDSPQFAEYRQLVARMFASGIEALEAGKRDGSVRADLDPSRVAVQLWGATLGVMMLEVNAAEVRRRFPPLVNLSSVASSFIDLAMDAIRAERAK
jgi:hypothetical protein